MGRCGALTRLSKSLRMPGGLKMPFWNDSHGPPRDCAFVAKKCGYDHRVNTVPTANLRSFHWARKVIEQQKQILKSHCCNADISRLATGLFELADQSGFMWLVPKTCTTVRSRMGPKTLRRRHAGDRKSRIPSSLYMNFNTLYILNEEF